MINYQFHNNFINNNYKNYFLLFLFTFIQIFLFFIFIKFIILSLLKNILNNIKIENQYYFIVKKKIVNFFLKFNQIFSGFFYIFFGKKTGDIIIGYTTNKNIIYKQHKISKFLNNTELFLNELIFFLEKNINLFFLVNQNSNSKTTIFKNKKNVFFQKIGGLYYFFGFMNFGCINNFINKQKYGIQNGSNNFINKNISKDLKLKLILQQIIFESLKFAIQVSFLQLFFFFIINCYIKKILILNNILKDIEYFLFFNIKNSQNFFFLIKHIDKGTVYNKFINSNKHLQSSLYVVNYYLKNKFIYIGYIITNISLSQQGLKNFGKLTGLLFSLIYLVIFPIEYEYNYQDLLINYKYLVKNIKKYFLFQNEKNMNLKIKKIEQGDIIFIYGENGSGKTYKLNNIVNNLKVQYKQFYFVFDNNINNKNIFYINNFDHFDNFFCINKIYFYIKKKNSNILLSDKLCKKITKKINNLNLKLSNLFLFKYVNNKNNENLSYFYLKNGNIVEKTVLTYFSSGEILQIILNTLFIGEKKQKKIILIDEYFNHINHNIICKFLLNGPKNYILFVTFNSKFYVNYQKYEINKKKKKILYLKIIV